MELIGKTKEYFEKWLYTVYFKEYYQYQMIWQLMGESARNGVYLEWFDSVGLKIGVYPNMYGRFIWHTQESGTYRRWSNDMSYETRPQATTEAIKKANEIYNTKN